VSVIPPKIAASLEKAGARQQVAKVVERDKERRETLAMRREIEAEQRAIAKAAGEYKAVWLFPRSRRGRELRMALRDAGLDSVVVGGPYSDG
jgi:hypothetical protein